MSLVPRLVVGGAFVAAATLTGAPLAWAGAAPCDDYSESCETPRPTPTEDEGDAGISDKENDSGAAAEVDELPFTGGEVAGAAAAGLVAVGVGTALVVAGRRRSAA